MNTAGAMAGSWRIASFRALVGTMRDSRRRSFWLSRQRRAARFSPASPITASQPRRGSGGGSSAAGFQG